MTGRPVYATLCSPVMGIFAEPGSCNVQAEWSTFKTTAQGPLVMLDVIGSNHCDPINPAMIGCDLVCGGISSPQNQANYSRHATAYFLAMLKDDAAAAATLTASVLAANTALRSTVVRAAPNCAVGPTDGGLDASSDVAPPADAAPPSDAGGPSDVAPPFDMGTGDAPMVRDAPPDNATAPDAALEAGSDVATPLPDGSRDTTVETSPSDAPPSDAGPAPPDGSLRPPTDGGTGGTVPTGGETQGSGCDCALALQRGQGRAALPAIVLFALVAIARRRAREHTSPFFIRPSRRWRPMSRR